MMMRNTPARRRRFRPRLLASPIVSPLVQISRNEEHHGVATAADTTTRTDIATRDITIVMNENPFQKHAVYGRVLALATPTIEIREEEDEDEDSQEGEEQREKKSASRRRDEIKDEKLAEDIYQKLRNRGFSFKIKLQGSLKHLEQRKVLKYITKDINHIKNGRPARSVSSRGEKKPPPVATSDSATKVRNSRIVNQQLGGLAALQFQYDPPPSISANMKANLESIRNSNKASHRVRTSSLSKSPSQEIAKQVSMASKETIIPPSGRSTALSATTAPRQRERKTINLTELDCFASDLSGQMKQKDLRSIKTSLDMESVLISSNGTAGTRKRRKDHTAGDSGEHQKQPSKKSKLARKRHNIHSGDENAAKDEQINHQTEPTKLNLEPLKGPPTHSMDMEQKETIRHPSDDVVTTTIAAAKSSTKSIGKQPYNLVSERTNSRTHAIDCVEGSSTTTTDYNVSIDQSDGEEREAVSSHAAEVSNAFSYASTGSESLPSQGPKASDHSDQEEDQIIAPPESEEEDELQPEHRSATSIAVQGSPAAPPATKDSFESTTRTPISHVTNSSHDVVDTDGYFVEETGWRCQDRHQPLLPPLPLPLLPAPSQGCAWSCVDQQERLLRVDIRGELSAADRDFYFRMAERDDVSVVADFSLMSQKFKDIVDLDLMLSIAANHHQEPNLRVFEREKGEESKWKFVEKNKRKLMDMKTYQRYLRLKKEVMGESDAKVIEEKRIFRFKDRAGNEVELDLVNEVLYLIDFDCRLTQPGFMQEFRENFQLRDTLPGSKKCLMSEVPVLARPDLGPLIFSTEPGPSTLIHQDGNGTVDSGHFCCEGNNEVLILRRLPEEHKKNAVRLLTGPRTSYDPLRGEPHDVVKNDKRPCWPTKQAVAECRAMSYCPSVLILKKYQFLHIGKGRLHAFRKMTNDELPESDCHSDARRKRLEEMKAADEVGYEHFLCKSIAWDWMFTGQTAEGINRELSYTLECSEINAKHRSLSLAIPEIGILKAVLSNIVHAKESRSESNRRSAKEKLRGMLPSLRAIVSKESERVETLVNSGTTTICEIPDTQDRGDHNGNGMDGFSCMLCSKELSNSYAHCNGCEKLLGRDYNICIECYINGKRGKDYFMLGFNETKSNLVSSASWHVWTSRRRSSTCHDGILCAQCSECTCCACKCHSSFAVRYRILTPNQLQQALADVDTIVGGAPVRYADETAERLEAIRTRGGKSHSFGGKSSTPDTSTQTPPIDYTPTRRSLRLQLSTSKSMASLEKQANGDDF